MIVELIGCAGAGKTTLGRMLCQLGIGGSPVSAMPELVLGRALLRNVTHPTAVNVVQEIFSFPYFIRRLHANPEYVRFAHRILSRHARTTFDELNGMRGVVRKLGMYEMAASRAERRIVISDEGTLLSAYNLFGMTTVDIDPLVVETFLELVPLPDKVVYVSAPASTLIERARTRPTPRRQHRGRTDAEVEGDIFKTVELFDLIASCPVLADRLLIVENDDGDGLAQRQRAEQIANWLKTLALTPREREYARVFSWS